MVEKAKKKPLSKVHKFSELIRLALDDLRKVERSKKYVINMEEMYHEPLSGVCAVCLAGAVIARTLGQPRDRLLEPMYFQRSIQERLYALDYLRMGVVSEAADILGKDGDRYVRFNRRITRYKRDPAAFRKDMRQLAKDLAAAGH